MRIKHFYDESQLKRNDRAGLERLLWECDFAYIKEIAELIDPVEQTSVFCLYDDYSEICAFASVTDYDTYLQIDKIYVDATDRRKGYGKILLDQAIKFSKSKGYDVTFLNVAIANKNAQNFYESQKFMIDRIVQGRDMISMKRFNSNFVFGVSEILYHLSKKMELNEVREKLQTVQGIEELKNEFNDFYKNGRKNEVEKLDKRLESKLIKNTIALINSETLSEDVCEEDKNKAKLCHDCYKSLILHETEKKNERLTK